MATGKPTYPSRNERQRACATRLRREMTVPERLLWRVVRNHIPLRSTHFRRQVALGPYIADFCCLAARLVVEVDGEQHGWETESRKDAARDAFLHRQGFRVLRFSNHDVRRSMPGVLDTIWAALNEPQSLGLGATPTPSPSPQGGGEHAGA
ncbi:endonuclease domain-containing protein [Alsobacter sp. KACC 23698]|uniref:endonuclease domain-containing protein n=1 Tax=Alsobacter sp. KACC 23698 TaxID=3149229 RepID=UPI0038783A88